MSNDFQEKVLSRHVGFAVGLDGQIRWDLDFLPEIGISLQYEGFSFDIFDVVRFGRFRGFTFSKQTQQQTRVKNFRMEDSEMEGAIVDGSREGSIHAQFVLFNEFVEGHN